MRDSARHLCAAKAWIPRSGGPYFPKGPTAELWEVLDPEGAFKSKMVRSRGVVMFRGQREGIAMFR